MTICVSLIFKNNITRHLCFKNGLSELQNYIFDYLTYDQIESIINIPTGGKDKLTNYLDFIKLFVHSVKIYATKKSLHYFDNNKNILKTPKQLKDLGFTL